MRTKLAVVVPSRTQTLQRDYLQNAVASIATQSVIQNFEVDIFLALDPGATLDITALESSTLRLHLVHANARSQAAALNAALRRVAPGTALVALLEDDDRWQPHYLEVASIAIASAGFVSSTQLEVTAQGEILRINDFPTPSGWLMSFDTLQRVGEFDETYRFHLDNEWLGRLCEAQIARIHLTESTAPGNMAYVPLIRPWLANVVQYSGGMTRLIRHSSPYPLVQRLVHANSGMSQIANDPVLKALSDQEVQRLHQRFGRTPW